jgi:hypothetical protein
MAQYLIQKMSSGTLKPITYYRKQSAHPSHSETGRFTQEAKKHYAKARGIQESEVDVGNFKSGQGVPTGGETEEI